MGSNRIPCNLDYLGMVMHRREKVFVSSDLGHLLSLSAIHIEVKQVRTLASHQDLGLG